MCWRILRSPGCQETANPSSAVIDFSVSPRQTSANKATHLTAVALFPHYTLSPYDYSMRSRSNVKVVTHFRQARLEFTAAGMNLTRPENQTIALCPPAFVKLPTPFLIACSLRGSHVLLLAPGSVPSSYRRPASTIFNLALMLHCKCHRSRQS